MIVDIALPVDSMLATIALPADIPGLLRRGSPIVATLRPWTGWPGLWQRDGAASLERSDGNRSVTIYVDDPRDVALDLTDATGRAHAVGWWNGKRQRSHYISEPFFGDMINPAVQYLSAGRHLHAVSRLVGRPGYLATADVVPVLATLDPNDPRTLPDGSRWVDAEALRLVCLHVAGRTP